MNDGAAIDAVGQPIPGDIAIEEGVSLDLGKRVNEPEAQGRSGREREQDGKYCTETEGGHPPK